MNRINKLFSTKDNHTCVSRCCCKCAPPFYWKVALVTVKLADPPMFWYPAEVYKPPAPTVTYEGIVIVEPVACKFQKLTAFHPLAVAVKDVKVFDVHVF